MKKLLVPTDFSKESEYALKAAANMAKKYDAEIIALHMLEIPKTLITREEDEEYPELMFFMKLAKQRFEKFLDKPYLEGIKVNQAVQHHLAFDGIIESAKKENADLIVMGSHGASGFKEVFVGSNTEKVVRTSDIPVLVVKKDQENIDIKNFVFASNFIEDCLEAFKKARKFAITINAKITLLYINTPGPAFKSTEEIELKINHFLEKLSVEDVTFEIYNEYDVERGILKYCNKNNIDLIGIPTHGRKGLAHMLKGSIGESLANHANIPVITFKI